MSTLDPGKQRRRGFAAPETARKGLRREQYARIVFRGEDGLIEASNRAVVFEARASAGQRSQLDVVDEGASPLAHEIAGLHMRAAPECADRFSLLDTPAMERNNKRRESVGTGICSARGQHADHASPNATRRGDGQNSIRAVRAESPRRYSGRRYRLDSLTA